jgi:acetyltransferase-like isoleucine patch superfamily enzyme
MIALPYSEICFGEDCMVSRRVSVQSNDGHDIFDVKTGQNINAAVELSKLRKVIVGNYVWIGQDAFVLYNTDIGDGSIIRAKSFVKNRFPNNCAAGGNHAKIIRTRIAWSRSCGDTDINVINDRYVRLTEE